MFEEDSETEEEDVAGTPEAPGDSEEDKTKKLGPLQLINSALSSGTKAALKEAKKKTPTSSTRESVGGSLTGSPKLRRKSMRHSISGDSTGSGRQAGSIRGGGSGRERSASDVSFMAPPSISGAKTTPTKLTPPGDGEEETTEDAAAAVASSADAVGAAAAAIDDVDISIISPKDEIEALGGTRAKAKNFKRKSAHIEEDEEEDEREEEKDKFGVEAEKYRDGGGGRGGDGGGGDGANDEIDKDDGDDWEEEIINRDPNYPDTCWEKSKRGFQFLVALISGSIDSFIDILNDISKDYRYVAKVLAVEKKILKAKGELDYKIPPKSKRNGASRLKEYGTIEAQEKQTQKAKDQAVVGDLVLDVTDIGEKKFERSQPRIFRLIVALYHGLVSKSEFLCYFAMVLNQMNSASVLSLPLPLMIFLWAMLSVPRPSKTFWITAITYTESRISITGWEVCSGLATGHPCKEEMLSPQRKHPPFMAKINPGGEQVG